MIIQCEQCRAKFRLDDSKVTDRGIKVRCAKCKYVFTVKKEEPVEERFDSSPSRQIAEEENRNDVSSPPPLQPEQPEQAPAPEAPFSFGDDLQENSIESTVRMDTPNFETNSLDSSFANADKDEFSLSSLGDDAGFAVDREETSSTHGDFDFDSLNFNAGAGDSDKTMVAPPASVDFGAETMIFQPTKSASDVNESEAAELPGDDIFSSAAGLPLEETENKSSETCEKTDDTFSLRDVGFGDEPASAGVQQVTPAELKPAGDIMLASLAAGADKSEPAASDLQNASIRMTENISQEELPPLPISSRRKSNSLVTGLAAAAAILVVALLGYFGLRSPAENTVSPPQETGRITVRGVKAAYQKNASAGQLLVISGEAVNEYPKPRAALQIKGSVLDGKGQVLTSKSAFAGNLLTEAQLATMPLDKIEAAMANQFGDSLSNLEVAPGKSVPFMIIIPTPPLEGKDFGVEPSGSTVAAAKK